MASTIRVTSLGAHLGEGNDGPVRARALMEHLSAETGSDAMWADSGREVLAEPWDPHPLHAVRSLAAHVDYPRKLLFVPLPFKLLDDPRDYPSLRRIFDGEQTTFPHLMRHSDNKGLWVPVPLPHPVLANEEAWWMVGSVHGVLDELERLVPLLEETDPALQDAHATLTRIFTAARDASLPVIID